MSIRVVVAGQNEIVRSALSRILDAQTDISVAGDAADVPSVTELVATLNPDIAVVDLAVIAKCRSSDMEEIMRTWASTKVIIFSLRGGMLYVNHCVRAGAKGYVLAEFLGSQIVDAVRDVYSGRLYLSSCLSLENSTANRQIDVDHQHSP